MSLSQTLADWTKSGYLPSEPLERMRDVCALEGFDLDDFLFQIWKDTLND